MASRTPTRMAGSGRESSNPNDPGDVTGPVADVCTFDKLRPVTFLTEEGADLQLALPTTFTEITPIKIGAAVKGAVGYDSRKQVAFLLFRIPAPTGATDPLGDEEALRPAIASTGALSNRTAQLFTTWEGFSALETLSRQAGTTTDLKRRTDELVDALVPGSTGRLSSAAAGVTGDFQLQSLIVHRSPQSVVVLIALTQLSAVTGGNEGSSTAFVARDLVNGSALAQFGEPSHPRCERLLSGSTKVDLLFVVDDSGSMAGSQTALADAATSAISALNVSSLDWRMAMVTSSYHTGTYANTSRLRPFTRNVNKVKAWLTTNSTCTSGVCSVVPTTPAPATCPGDTTQGYNGGCWVGVTGNGVEGLLGAARKGLDTLTPGTEPGAPESEFLARKGAQLVVVLLGDADDQTTGYSTTAANCGSGGTLDKAGTGCESVTTFAHFFGDGSTTPPTNKTGAPIAVHGIVCPSGQACGCSSGTCNPSNASREFNPQPIGGVSQLRHAAVVNATGGVLGSVVDSASIKASMEAIVAATIAHGGDTLSQPPAGRLAQGVRAERGRPGGLHVPVGRAPQPGEWLRLRGQLARAVVLRRLPSRQRHEPGRRVLYPLRGHGEGAQRGLAVQGGRELHPERAGPLHRPPARLRRGGHPVRLQAQLRQQLWHGLALRPGQLLLQAALSDRPRAAPGRPPGHRGARRAHGGSAIHGLPAEGRPT